MKPSWNDAPEWAQWLAMDEDCEWFWYEKKPSLSLTVFRDAGGMVKSARRERWRETLEQRPKT